MYKITQRLGAVALAVSFAAIIAACGGGGGDDAKPAATGETFQVSGKEFAFEPANLTATADTPFTVEFANAGLMEHDFVIEGMDSGEMHMGSGEGNMHLGPGSTGSATFTLAAGTYKFFCSIPGHEVSGMVGTLTVK